MSWRAQINQARSIVHDTMAVDCIHCSRDGSVQRRARVRYHYSRGALGHMPGSDGYGERAANFTDIVFDDTQLALTRGEVLVFENGEVLEVDTVMPRDVRTGFRKANVAQVEHAAFAITFPFLTSGQPWAGLTFPAA